MEDLSLHILDVAENAVRAGASEIFIEIEEQPERGTLELRIRDDGRGMDAVTARKAADPFFTTREKARVGLGLPLLRQAAEDTGGGLRIVTGEGAGTEVIASFQSGHPDMKPIGDVPGTLAALIAGHPAVRFVFDCRTGTERTRFDSRPPGPAPDGRASGQAGRRAAEGVRPW
ncbi:MAG: ATP-binding protein [Lentisphaerae bacterium]|nr:ATP-binding protein [Lentisphaerota bacterium]